MVNMHSDSRYELKKPIDSLTQERWIFWQQGTTLYLDEYHYEQRETSRHKFKPTKIYERLRQDRDYPSNRISEQDVPLPDDVVNEVVAYVGSLLIVKRWKRR